MREMSHTRIECVGLLECRRVGILRTLDGVGTYELVFILYDAFFFHVFLSFWLRLLMDCLLLTFIPLLLAAPCAHLSDD